MSPETTEWDVQGALGDSGGRHVPEEPRPGVPEGTCPREPQTGRAGGAVAAASREVFWVSFLNP